MYDMKQLKRVVRSFSDTEAAWLAAVVDGEGSIGLYKKRRRKNGKEYLGRTVVIQMSNTNRSFVQRMADVIGCGSTVLRIINFGRHHKGRQPIFKYSLEGSERCRRVLEQIVEHLIVKRKKAEAILTELSVRPFGRWARHCKKAKETAAACTRATWTDPKVRARRLHGLRTYYEKRRMAKS